MATETKDKVVDDSAELKKLMDSSGLNEIECRK